jgi:hypothetical protein
MQILKVIVQINARKIKYAANIIVIHHTAPSTTAAATTTTTTTTNSQPVTQKYANVYHTRKSLNDFSKVFFSFNF